ncbi:MAG: peptide ABC transporter substrate-binding protein [Tumebacillaceae bacterium]
MKKKLWLNVGLATTVLAGMALVGCGGGSTTTDATPQNNGGGDKPDAKQEINLALTDELPTLDVSKATDNLSFTVLGQIGEGLTRLDHTNKVIPGIAEKWDISADGLKYTFHLRDNAKWSNGDPVTAKDFEYSWKRTLNPKTGAQYAFMVAWVKGGDEYNGGKVKTPDNVGVKALDDKTLEVTLSHPVPFFLEQMTFPVFFPQDQKFVEAAGDKNGADADKVNSNGPFKLTDWQHEQTVTLVKNDTYYNKDQIKLTKVNYQVLKDSTAAVNLYETGQLDRSTGLVRDQIDTYKSSPEYGTEPELTNGYLEFNEKEKVFTSAKIRQAFTYAIDGDAFADIVYHNGTKGATGLVPDGTSNGQGGDFRKDQGDLINRAANAAKAKDLLAEGLKEVGMTSFPKVKFTIDDGDVGKKAAEFLKEQWRSKLGVDVEVEAVPFKLRLDKEAKHNYDLGWALWGADYNDPMTFLDMWTSDSPFNDAVYKNPAYDTLIKQAQTEPDGKKRMGYLSDAEKLLMQDMPVGPVFFRARAYLTKPYVKDWTPRVSGPSYDLYYTYLQGKK